MEIVAPQLNVFKRRRTSAPHDDTSIRPNAQPGLRFMHQIFVPKTSEMDANVIPKNSQHGDLRR